MDDYSGLLKRALAVDPFAEPYDLNKPPLTAQEYLQYVVTEAANCDDVVVAEIDRTQFESKRTPCFECPPGCAEAPAFLIPSIEWQHKQISEFSCVRMMISRYRDMELKFDPEVLLPAKNDKAAWMNFCLGDAYKKSSENDGQEYGGELPYVSTILAMNQPVVEQVLEYHSNWIEKCQTLSHQQGRWLYALMAALQLPLLPEVCYILRTLARECARIRAVAGEDNVEPSHITSLNLIICLVALYFRQNDLADM